MTSSQSITTITALHDLLDNAPNRPKALTGSHYMNAHVAFESASTQQSEVRQHIERAIVSLANDLGRPIRVLSLGCGSGFLDLPILKHCNDEILRYDAVDPNGAEINAFKSAAEGALHKDDKKVCFFEETGENFLDRRSENSWDLLICSHVLYYVEDRRAFIRLMRERLDARGLILMVHAPNEAMNQLAQTFWDQQAVTPFFTDELVALMSDLDINFERTDIHGLLPAELLDPAVPQGRLIIEFIIQSDWQTITGPIRKALMRALDACIIDAHKSKVFPHPASIFRIQHS